MANIRTLKLNLLADTTNFEKGIKKASGQSSGFAKNIARNFAMAGAAIGGAAIALGVDAVKSAIADQKSQALLAKQLKTSTKATKGQIAATEKWITAQQMAYGVADSDLRPALSKLVRVTGDVGRSQKLLSLAMDLSASSGVDLETATNAIAKAQQGQFKGLKALGIPLTDAIIKNKDLAAALKITEDTTKGAAKAAGDTFAGKLARFNQAIGEAKETLGTAILTAIQPLADEYLPKIVSGITSFVNGLTGSGGKDGLNDALKDGSGKWYQYGEDAKKALKYFIDHKDTLAKTATIIGAIFIGAKAGAAAQGMITAVKSIITVMRALTTASAIAAGAEAAATGGTSFYAALPAIGAIATAFGVAALMGLGNTPKPKTTAAQQQRAAAAVTALQDLNNPVTGLDLGGTGGLGGDSSKRKKFRGGTTVINLNGIVDAESARRSIVTILNDSAIRTSPINLGGAAI